MAQKSHYSRKDGVVYAEPKNHRKHDIIFIIVATTIACLIVYALS